MVRRLCVIVVFTIILFLGDISIAQNFKDGLWEITTKMEMPGMPMQMSPQTIKQCIKKDDPVPKLEESDKNCKITSKQIKGDTVSWKAECRDKEGVFAMSGIITYRGNTFDGMQEYRENGELVMKSKISGKWLGQCK